jgi:cellulose synthase/poly-beta-1,6-N-acetylglucosamine synthase-like glycosyltransferase
MIFVTLILLVIIAYAGLIVAFTIGLKRALPQALSQNDIGMPISVVVAFKDEALNLPNLLEAMVHQSFPTEKFEVILVNDHSTDASASIVKRYCTLNSIFRVIDLPESKAGKKAAIAFGISSATHPLIAITDADCIPSFWWLKAISSEAKKGSALMLGPVIMVSTGNYTQKFQALEYSSLMASAAGSCGVGHPVIASSANLAFRNDLLNISEITLNPKVTSGDDMFLLHHAKRFDKNKISFLGSRNAIVKTSTVATLQKAMTQRKRWASKSIYYRDFDTIVTGFIVLLFNLSLVLLLIASLFSIRNLYYFILLLLIKTLVDFVLLCKYLSFVEQKELLKVFLPLQLAYPFYIAYSFFAGVFIKVSWKGRRID